jgi:hypothetical protein
MGSVKRGERSAAIRDYLKAHPGAGPKVVVEALAEEGVVVSKNLVSSIKYGKLANKGAGRPRSKKSGKVSGSEAIRQVLARDPHARPKAIREELASQGIRVKTGLISFVKFKFNKQGGAPKVRSAARVTAAPKVADANFSFNQLLKVKEMADSLGGADQLRLALDMLSQLA